MDELKSLEFASLASGFTFWDWPDVNKNDMWWSDELIKDLGYNPQTFIPGIEIFKSHVHSNDLPKWELAISTSRKRTDRIKIEIRIKTKNEQYESHFVTIKSFFNGNGRCRMAGSVQKIIEEKEHFSPTDEKVLKAQNTALIGFWEYDIDANEIKWSHQSYRNYGLNPDTDQIDFRKLMSLIHPDYHHYHQDVMNIILSQGQGEFEYPIITPIGEIRWIWGAGEVLKDENDKPYKLFGLLQNITERKRREALLKDQEFLLNEVGRLAKVGGWRYNIKTGLGKVTEEVARIHGITVEEFNSADIGLSFYLAEDRKIIEAAIDKAIKEKKPYDLELRIKAKTGEVKWVRTIGYPIVSSQGEVVGLKGSFQDITDSKAAEAIIKESKNRLQHQTEVFTRLMTKGTWLRSDFKDGLAEIIETSADLFQTDRVSIWWFDENLTVLTCFNAYHKEDKNHLIGEQIYCANALNYTKRLISGKVINAYDVFTDKYATEMPHEYYRKYNIKSEMDVPIWFEGKVGGIICFEETKGHRQWTAEDERLAISMAALVSLCYETLERRKAEKELGDQENRLRLALQAAKQGIYDLNIKTGEAIVNDEYVNMLGYDPKDFAETNQYWVERSHPDDREKTAKFYKDYIHGKIDEYSVEFRQKTKSGKWKWIHSLGKIVEFSDQNEPLRMLGIHTDIHERKLAEEKINEYNKRLEIFRQIYKDIIIAVDPRKIADTVLKRIDDLVPYEIAAIGLFKESFENIQIYSFVNKTSIPLQNGEQFTQQMTDRMKVLANGDTLVVNNLDRIKKLTDIGRKLLSMGILSHISIPLKAQKNVFGVLTIASNKRNYFTKEKKEIVSEIAGQLAISIHQAQLSKQIEQYNAELEKRVKERTAQLEKANKELEAFSYSVSHDLRTPVRAINGYSNILLEDYKDILDNEGIRLLNLVVDNTKHMRNLIDDILSLAKISRKQLAKNEVHLNKVIQECLKNLEHEIKERDIKWKIDDLPVIHADSMLINQLFFNLISNAIKFTKNRDHAVIEIGLKQVDNDKVYFVRDNGVGFNMSFVNKLFKPFQRLHSLDEFEGTGVGLAIVKRIVEKYNGNVWVESEENVGAHFQFTLLP